MKVLIKEPFRAGHRIRFNSAIKSSLSDAVEFLQGTFDTDEIDKPIKDAMDSKGLPDIDYIIFHVKSAASGARQSTTTLSNNYNDLTQDVWDVQIEPTILDEYQQHPGWKLDVIVEFITQKAPPKENSKRSLAIAALHPTASSHRRRTRTVQQEEAAEAQRDRNKQSGDYGEALLEKWTCKSDKCINEHGVCYVAYDAKHYSLTMAQLQNWALAIGNRRDGASLNHPPVQLYAWRRGCPTK